MAVFVRGRWDREVVIRIHGSTYKVVGTHTHRRPFAEITECEREILRLEKAKKDKKKNKNGE